MNTDRNDYHDPDDESMMPEDRAELEHERADYLRDQMRDEQAECEHQTRKAMKPMTFNEVCRHLCTYDHRHPSYRDKLFSFGPAVPQPRIGCGCDNCYYGRDKLAMEILRLMEEQS